MRDDTQLAVPNPLQSAALARPTHPVLWRAGDSVDARTLRDRVAARAGRLARAGVSPASRVVLLPGDPVDLVVSFHAVGWLGAAVAPLAASAPVPELRRNVAAVNATHLLDGRTPPARTSSLRDELPVLSALPDAPPAPERFWPLDECRAVLLTSGSTGAPQAVPLSTAQVLFAAFGSLVRLGHARDDRWLHCLPLYHVGGASILWRAALAGVAVELAWPFDAGQVAARLDSGEISLVSLVPTMLQRLLDERAAVPFPPALRAILLGGAAAPSELLERCRTLQAPVAVTWGMTESAAQVATACPGEIPQVGQVGPPLPFVRIEADGERLVVAGPTVAGGRLRTADLGHVDAAGQVHVSGRADAGIQSGGETVQPDEVEATLRSHPAVDDAAVVGVRDPVWGERVVGFLTRAPGSRATRASAMQSWCRTRLAPHKIPRSLVWIDLLPLTDTGKLDRATLRALALQHAESLERHHDLGRHRDRLQATHVDKGVDQARAGPTAVVSHATNDVVDGHRALSESGHRQNYAEPVAEPDRALEVGLGVDDRRAPSTVGEEVGEMNASDSSDQLLVGTVTVLEEAREVDEPGAVDLAKANGDRMLERHDDSSILPPQAAPRRE